MPFLSLWSVNRSFRSGSMFSYWKKNCQTNFILIQRFVINYHNRWSEWLVKEINRMMFGLVCLFHFGILPRPTPAPIFAQSYCYSGHQKEKWWKKQMCLYLLQSFLVHPFEMLFDFVFNNWLVHVGNISSAQKVAMGLFGRFPRNVGYFFVIQKCYAEIIACLDKIFKNSIA